MRNRLLVLALLFSTCLAAQQPARRITRFVSAASRTTHIAPGSIATIYGDFLADSTESAAGMPLPMRLAGVGVLVSGPGFMMGAQLISASPNEITFVVPASTRPGTATVMVVGLDTIHATSTVPIEAIAPGLFSANGTGTGAAAATAFATLIPTVQKSPVEVYACDIPAIACHTIPVDPGIDRPVTFQFAATGIRAGANITATIGGMPVPVQSAGAQPNYPGLDQVNIPLILSLRGSGVVDVVITVDGIASNAVQVAVQ